MWSSFWCICVLWVAGGWPLTACSRETVRRTIVSELARHNDLLNDKINTLCTRLRSLQQQQRHYKLALANQRQRDESWWERRFATGQNRSGWSAAVNAVERRPERRRLVSCFQKHNGTPIVLDVEGTCACTKHMLAAGMNVTQVLDKLFERQTHRNKTNATGTSTSRTTAAALSFIVEPIDWADLSYMTTDSANGRLTPSYSGSAWKIANAYGSQYLSIAGDYMEFQIASGGEFMVGCVTAPDEDNLNAIYEAESMFFTVYKHLDGQVRIKVPGAWVNYGHFDYSLPFRIEINDDLKADFLHNGTLLTTSAATVQLPARPRADSANGGEVFFAYIGYSKASSDTSATATVAVSTTTEDFQTTTANSSDHVWKLGGSGETCDAVCEGIDGYTCDDSNAEILKAINASTIAAFIASIEGPTCVGPYQHSGPWAPFYTSTNNNCYYWADEGTFSGDPTCAAQVNPDWHRACYCTPF